METDDLVQDLIGVIDENNPDRDDAIERALRRYKEPILEKYKEAE